MTKMIQIQIFIIFSGIIIQKVICENSSPQINSRCNQKNCLECDTESKYCKICKTSFILNEEGLCVCKPNQFLHKDNECVYACPIDMIENKFLNICEEANNCNNGFTIEKNQQILQNLDYLQPYSIQMFFDQDLQIYIQVFYNGSFIYLFDSTSYQFLVQIKASTDKILTSYYDYFGNNLILTNQRTGEVEIWDITNVNQKSYLKVNNTNDNKDLIYLKEVNKLLFLNSSNLTMMDVDSTVQKILPIQLDGVEFDAIYINQIKSIFVVQYEKVFQITVDEKDSIQFQNSNNQDLESQHYDFITPTINSNLFIQIKEIKQTNLITNETILIKYFYQYKIYNFSTKRMSIINQLDINQQQGIFMDKIYEIYNDAGLGNYLQFYEFKQDQLVKVGSPYFLSNSKILISYDFNKKGIRFKYDSNILTRFDLDISENNIFTNQMFTNIQPFDVQISIKDVLIDEQNRRLILKDSQTFLVLNLDNLQIIYKFSQNYYYKEDDYLTVLNKYNIYNRPDVINLSQLLITKNTTLQSINVLNGQVNMRQTSKDNYQKYFITKDFLIANNTNLGLKFSVFKLTNLQKIDIIQIKLNKCSSEFFQFKSNNDFIILCGLEIYLYQYITQVETYSIQRLYKLQSINKNIKINVINDHIIVCYDYKCYYHLKTQSSDSKQMFFSKSQIQIDQIITQNDYNFFIIKFSDQITFISYPEFKELKIEGLSCISLIEFYYFGQYKIHLYCENDQSFMNTIQIKTQPKIEIKTQSVNINDIFFDKLFFINHLTILFQLRTKEKLYFFTYKIYLKSDSLKMIQKDIIYSGYISSTQFYLGFDRFWRRMYFETYGELSLAYEVEQIQFFQYQEQYYSLIDEQNINQIILLKTCFQNENIIGILREGRIYIQDLMKNKNYNQDQQNISDIYIDSSINVVFYLLSNSDTIYCFDYVQNKLIKQHQLKVVISYFSEFIGTKYSKSFVVYSKVNYEVQYCEYMRFPKENISCFPIIISTSQNIDKIVSYNDSLLIISQNQHTYIQINLLDPSIQYTIKKIIKNTRLSKLNQFTNTGYLNFFEIFKEKLFSSDQYFDFDLDFDRDYVNQVKIYCVNCQLIDIILAEIGYINIFEKCMQAFSKSSQMLKKTTYYTKVLIKKAIYYKNYIVVYISNDNNIYLQSIQVSDPAKLIIIGEQPLENILYMNDEDIILVLNVSGQIFRIDLKKEKDEQIINVLEIESNIIMKQVYFNKVINKIIITSQNQIYMWDYSPFVGERLNFNQIRQKYYAVQHQINKDIIYYSDLVGNILQFNLQKQSVIGISPSDIINMYLTENYFVGFFLNHIQIYQNDTLKNQIQTNKILMSIKFNSSIFAFIDYNFQLYTLILTNNPLATPIYLEKQLPSTPQDIILVSDDTIIISLNNQEPIKYSLKDNQLQLLQGIPNLSQFIGQKFIPKENTIIIIEQKNILKLDYESLKYINHLSFPELDSAGYIESFDFDMDKELLFIHYSQQSYVFIISFNLKKESIKSIGCCDIYKVKFLIMQKYVAIYCQFQVNFHSRNSELSLRYSFRNPALVNSMFNLIILNDLYLIAVQSKMISIFSMNITENYGTFTFQWKFQTTQPTIFQCSIKKNQILIYGVGYEGSFYYIFSPNNKTENQKCLQKFTIINNLSLFIQVNFFKLVEQNLIGKYIYDIELDSNKLLYLPYIDDLKYNNKSIITYIPPNSNKELYINNNFFSKNQLNEIILKNFKFIIPKDTDNIIFNLQTKYITFKQITILDDLVNISFNFTNIQQVIISDLKISNINITDSTIFLLVGVNSIYLTNITIVNVNFINSLLFLVKDSQDIIFNDLCIENVNFLGKYNPIIDVRNSKQFELIYFKINGLVGNNTKTQISNQIQVYEHDNVYLQKQINHIIYLQKINKIQIKQGLCENLKNISIIKVDKFYSDKFVYQSLENSEIFIKSVQLKDNKLVNSIASLSASSISLNNITGIQNQCTDCKGSIFNFFETDSLTLLDSYFKENRAIHGGSLSLINCKNQSNNISNTIFISNSAIGSGGAVYLEKCNLILNNSNFTDNSALIGGAIRYKDFVPIFILEYRQSSKNIKFINNEGKFFGDNYGSYLGQIMVWDFDSKIKQDKQINQNNSEQLFIKGFSSGDYIELFFEIFDEERKKIKFNPTNISSSQIPESIQNEIKKIIIYLESESDKILIDESNFITFKQFEEQNQIYKYPKIRLISKQNNEAMLLVKTMNAFEIPFYLFDQIQRNLSIENLDYDLESNKYSQIMKREIPAKLKINFRECQRGEIYQNISQSKTICYKCPLGTYSIVNPNYYEQQECKQCSSYNTKECGNKTIILADGFWRLNEFSDKIVKCANRKENCKDRNDSINYCVEGLTGPLCEQCDNDDVSQYLQYKYQISIKKSQQGKVWGRPQAKTSDYQCAPCNDYSKTYIRQVLIFIGINVYIFLSYYLFCGIFIQKAIVYYLRISRIISFGNSSRRDQSSTYLKFFLNYAQLQSYVNQYNQDQILMTLKSIFGFPVTQFSTATDCQIQTIQNMHLYRIIIMMLLPILFDIWICLVYFLFSLFNKNSKAIKKKLSSLILISFIFFQPNIISFLIQSISCRQIGEYKYIVSDSRIKCLSDEHIYVIVLSIFGLLFWVGIVPIYIYRQLTNIKNVEWITIQYNYGFFYIEYKKSRIYWEIIRILTKFFVILTVNTLHEYVVTQFVFLSFVLFIYYYLTNYYSPFETNHMNQVDKYIITSLCIQVLINAIIKDLDESNHLTLIFQIICFSINIATLMSLILIISSQKLKFIRDNIQKIKLKLSNYKFLKKIKCLKLNNAIETNFNRFYLWKHLSHNLQYAVTQCHRTKYLQIYGTTYFKQEQNINNKYISKKNILNIENFQDFGQQTIKRKIPIDSSDVNKRKYSEKDNLNELSYNDPKNQISEINEKKFSIQNLMNSLQINSQKNESFLKSENEIPNIFINEISLSTFKSPTLQNEKLDSIKYSEDCVQNDFSMNKVLISEIDGEENIFKNKDDKKLSIYLSQEQTQKSFYSQKYDNNSQQKTLGDLSVNLDVINCSASSSINQQKLNNNEKGNTYESFNILRKIFKKEDQNYKKVL